MSKKITQLTAENVKKQLFNDRIFLVKSTSANSLGINSICTLTLTELRNALADTRSIFLEISEVENNE